LSHPPAEDVSHAESDGAKNYGNERKFQLQDAKVGELNGDMHLGADHRSDKFKLGSNVLFEVFFEFHD
jgi:hypothetical protein